MNGCVLKVLMCKMFIRRWMATDGGKEPNLPTSCLRLDICPTALAPDDTPTNDERPTSPVLASKRGAPGSDLDFHLVSVHCRSDVSSFFAKDEMSRCSDKFVV